jgi:hypothetical protein
MEKTRMAPQKGNAIFFVSRSKTETLEWRFMVTLTQVWYLAVFNTEKMEQYLMITTSYKIGITCNNDLTTLYKGSEFDIWTSANYELLLDSKNTFNGLTL